MNKTILLYCSLLLSPAASHSMIVNEWRKMRPKDDTSGLFVRQEFCFATGEWIDETTKDGQTEDWLWDQARQKYIRVNVLEHKDFRAAPLRAQNAPEEEKKECEEEMLAENPGAQTE